ncbi:hypothetical protein FQZ97_975250 [compost metagenome]
MSSTRQRGFRLAYGSWKIIWMRRRSLRPSGVLNAACASCPSNSKPPRVGSYRPTSSRATVLFPQPDSPTSASVWPRGMSKDTPSTARSSWRGWRSITRLSQGAETSKVLARSVARTSGALVAASLVAADTAACVCAVCDRVAWACTARSNMSALMQGHPQWHAASRRRAWRRPPADRVGPHDSGRTPSRSAGCRRILSESR